MELHSALITTALSKSHNDIITTRDNINECFVPKKNGHFFHQTHVKEAYFKIFIGYNGILIHTHRI